MNAGQPISLSQVPLVPCRSDTLFKIPSVFNFSPRTAVLFSLNLPNLPINIAATRVATSTGTAAAGYHLGDAVKGGDIENRLKVRLIWQASRTKWTPLMLTATNDRGRKTKPKAVILFNACVCVTVSVLNVYIIRFSIFPQNIEGRDKPLNLEDSVVVPIEYVKLSRSSQFEVVYFVADLRVRSAKQDPN